jgi:hypothetical protein
MGGSAKTTCGVESAGEPAQTWVRFFVSSLAVTSNTEPCKPMHPREVAVTPTSDTRAHSMHRRSTVPWAFRSTAASPARRQEMNNAGNFAAIVGVGDGARLYMMPNWVDSSYRRVATRS